MQSAAVLPLTALNADLSLMNLDMYKNDELTLFMRDLPTWKNWMNPEISNTKHVARMIAIGSGLDILCVGMERERKSLTNW